MTPSSGWTEISRTLTAVPAAGSHCAVSIWLSAERQIPPSGHLTVNVEVINPTTWTYMALKTVNLTAPLTYVKATSPTFTPDPSPFVFRVSVLALGGRRRVVITADDFSYACS